MGLATFDLKAGATNPHRRLSVNGETVEGVRSVQLHVPPDGVPVLAVTFLAEGVLEGEGIVQVQASDPPDAREIIGTFLNAIDPAQLEKDALAGMGMGDGSATPAILDTLKRYARGD